MTFKKSLNVKTSEAMITQYAIGALSPAKHVILTCQRDISEAVAERLAFQEDVAAAMLADVNSVALSPLFIGNVLAALPDQNDVELDNKEDSIAGLAPKSLRSLLKQAFKDIKWKTIVPGVAVHDIIGGRKTKNGDRLYLMKVKGGMKMPEHGHVGEEWTLILSGSYVAGGQTFSRGDLHIEEGNETHSPHVDEGEDCVCLVMTQNALKMNGWLPKLIQPLIGI